MFGQALRVLLIGQLELRRESDPKYTLRAMARDIGVPPAQLSLILSGKRGVSPGRAGIIAQKMGFPEPLASRFSLLATAAYSRSRSDRERARRELTRSARDAFRECEAVRHLEASPDEIGEILRELRSELLPFSPGEDESHEVTVVAYPAAYGRDS